jgi:C4-dicarboxylate-specific signal transduction histidine kinase
MVEEQMSYQPMSEPLKGLGVGLCLSTVYATHFGGSLKIESEGRNLGTTVTFTIPRNIDITEIH